MATPLAIRESFHRMPLVAVRAPLRRTLSGSAFEILDLDFAAGYCAGAVTFRADCLNVAVMLGRVSEMMIPLVFATTWR